MPRTCVFCGRSPTTKEHVWPSWLRKHLGIRENLPHTHLIERHGEWSDSFAWNSRPYTLTAKAVCTRCNNEWMSRLEENARRYLIGMTVGRGRQLHREGQQALGTWALLKAMMFDQASPPGARGIFPSFYEYVYQEKAPPPDVWVWLSSYAGTMPGFTAFTAVEVTPRGESDPPDRNVFIRTFNAGPVVFQIFGTTNPQLEEMQVGWQQGIPPGGSSIHQIWPIGPSFTWRASPGLSDEGIDWFSHAILRSLVSMSEEFAP